MRNELALRIVRSVHTAVWAVFAGCILAIPYAVRAGDLRTAFVLAAIVLAEVVVLLANGMRCPLTAVAARYTSDRADNFDICLPRWLARYNKAIFGTLFVADLILAGGRWLGASWPA
ncbi:MAG TPA: hypothetical protein VEC01_01450 [Noviherbaspirillum sp.]|uniref:hypothetical protein n=1 Tax=Noviherbaspirillum sp. TaxID=1926288 RepID=UPI002D731DB3|nr:hypothetical protein [Noviherbaspirillum sp.]HYD93961.1 hypothetical protein [Noviherbaspirillum sp.]